MSTSPKVPSDALRQELQTANARADLAEEQLRKATEAATKQRTEDIGLGIRAANEYNPSKLGELRNELTALARPRRWYHAVISLVGRLAIPIGIITTFATYVTTSFKEADDRFRTAYVKLGDSYDEIVKSCAENPDLDCYDMTHEQLQSIYGAYSPAVCTNNRVLRQQIIYTRLLNYFEQAYTLLDSRHDFVARWRPGFLTPAHNAKDVWPGWEKYIYSYMRRPAFRKVWSEVSSEWSGVFRHYMDCLCRSSEAKDPGAEDAVFAKCDTDPGTESCVVSPTPASSTSTCTPSDAGAK